MQTIYHYSAENGEYLGAGQPDPNPLEPGKFLYPANCSTVAPPNVTLPNTVARFSNGAWAVVPDFRGTKYWIGKEEFTIKSINELVPDGATKTAPAPNPDGTPTPTDVNAERDLRVLRGVTIRVADEVLDAQGNVITPPVDVRVGGDETTKINLLGLVQAATMRVAQGDVTTITKYRDETNTIFDLTPPQIIQVWQGGATYVSAVFAASWAIKDDPTGIDPNFRTDPRWP